MPKTAEEQHLQDKEQHARRLAEKNKFDHVKRSTRLRRIYAQIRDHIKHTFKN